MEASQTQTTPQQPDHATLGALVVILLSGLPAPQMLPMVEALLLPFAIPPAAASAALGLLWPHLDHTIPDQPASALGFTLRTQVTREAAYLWNAAKRIASDPTQIRAAVGQERVYLGQHLAAERGRRDAARAVDTAAAEFGPEIGWYAMMDAKTTAGCAAMNGRNFNVAVPPVVEGRPAYPGAVHLHCRCKPGAPHRAAVREPARALVGA